MLDIGWQELLIVGTLAIIVVGPKDLPRALRTIMGGIRKARGIAKEFQNGVDEMVREADLDDLRQELNKVGDGDIKKTISDAVDPDGDLAKQMDMNDVQKDLDKIAKETSKDTSADKPEVITDNEPGEIKPLETKPPEEPEKPVSKAQNS